MIDLTTQMNIQRTLVAQTFVDTCQITRKGTTTVSDRGIVIPAARTIVQYNGSNNTPCRVEVARAFMNDRERYQPVVTDNYVIYLPYDIDLTEEDEIVWNGDTYDIRKLIKAGNMDAFSEALIFHTNKVQS